MGFFAPRLPPRLVDEIDRLADRPDRAADICRMIGERAEEQGVRRPSYEQVRQYVLRARSRPRSVSTGEVLLDVALRVHHPDAFIAHVSGTRTRFKLK
ncbi:MAG TPA: hypothetical protein VFK71_09790 [Gaiellaceae bacterium]|nr:hypothetical protein [Gaiellaceae bacterium]